MRCLVYLTVLVLWQLAAKAQPSPARDEISYSVLKEWDSARVKEPMVVVLTDEAAYTKLFAESFAEYRSPKPVAEKVDFKSKQVVAVCWGSRNSTGYRISVASVAGTPKETTITVKTTVPKGLAEPAITYPAVVLVIPKTESVKVVVTGDRLPTGWSDFTDLKKGLEVNVPPPAAEPKDTGPKSESSIHMEIAADKTEYPFRGAIRLTVTYTNTSTDTVELLANGVVEGGGFPGETYEVKSLDGSTKYAIHATDPKAWKKTLEPGKSWKRELDLAALTSGADDSKDRAGTDPLPDPFGRLYDYEVRLTWKSAVNVKEKPVVCGPIKSNVVKFKVRR